MNCFSERTASARLWLYRKRLYFISSAIAYCILPYASFYAELSCIEYLRSVSWFCGHYNQLQFMSSKTDSTLVAPNVARDNSNSLAAVGVDNGVDVGDICKKGGGQDFLVKQIIPAAYR